ncbi:hypothetical protein [Streptomyces sp. NBC_00005]|uniref:hypothetical protein n=1 Tax=Streptomyces sp. NBC_00005 TaxID=2903609 RepID=UPI0032522C10
MEQGTDGSAAGPARPGASAPLRGEFLAVSIVFVFWDHLTDLVVFWFALAILALFGVREFLAPGPGLAGSAGLGQQPPDSSGPPAPRPAPGPGICG